MKPQLRWESSHVINISREKALVQSSGGKYGEHGEADLCPAHYHLQGVGALIFIIARRKSEDVSK